MVGLPAVTLLTLSGALLSGLILALLGNLKLALAQRTELTEGRIGWLFAIFNVVLVGFLLAAGVLVDYWGIRPMMIAGSVVTALALLALTADLSYQRTLWVVLMAAFGAAAINVGTVVLMPRGLFSVREVAASMQVGWVFMALGALVGSLLADVLFRTLGKRRALPILALLALTPAFLAAMPGLDGAVEAQVWPDEMPALWTDASVWLAGLVFFVYAPLEAFVSVWTTTHIAGLRQAPHRAGRLLIAFWLAVLGSRMLLGLLEHQDWVVKGWGGWILVVPALLAAVVFGNMMGSVRHDHSLKGMLALGFFLGPILPSLLALVFRLDSARTAPGSAYGLVCALGSAGSLLLSPLVGVSARARNFQTALLIPLLLALVLTGASLLFAVLGPARSVLAP